VKTVRGRLTLFTVAVVAAILALMGLFVRFQVQNNLIAEIDRQLSEDVSRVKTGPIEPSEIAFPTPLPKADQITLRHSIAERQDTMMQILRSQGGDVRLEARWTAPRLIPVATDDIVPRAEDPEGVVLTRKGSPIRRDFSLKGLPMRSMTAPVRRDGKLIAFVQAIRPLTPVRNQMAELDRALATSIPVAILLAAIGGALLVGSSMRPLRKMTDSARSLDRDLSSARLPVEGEDEFAGLATTINAAFDRTAAAFAEQRRALTQLERFTGDAGHELRTPLASIKTNASYLLHLTEAPPEHQPALRLIDTSADRMTKLIGDLLLLARQDGGRSTLRLTSVDVPALIQDVVDTLPAEIPVQVTAPPLMACVDQDSVERVLLNLVSNALRYARTTVNVEASLTEGFLNLTVSDDGPGIAPDDVSRLGERFFRPDEARGRQEGGVGLGLAIARSLAESHGGDLTVESELGKGTTVRARFKT
jgi:two-component system OmpR family sensor kinase